MQETKPWFLRQTARSTDRQEVFFRSGNQLYLQTGEIDPKFWELLVLEDRSCVEEGHLGYQFTDTRSGRTGQVTWTKDEMLLKEGDDEIICDLIATTPGHRCLVALHEFDRRQRPVMVFGREDLGIFAYASDSIHGASARDGSPLWASRLFFVDQRGEGSIVELPFSELALGREYLSQSQHGMFYLFGPYREMNGIWKTSGGQHVQLTPLNLSDFEVTHHERTGALLSFAAKP